MNNKLQLSIIIPVYNVEKYLKECLDSVSQLNKYIDCEIIVVNDGSTDSSETIIAEYLDNPVFKLINQPNKGLSGARNTGIKAARGKYVYFLDSDDFIDAESFVKMFNAGYEKCADTIIGECYLYYSTQKYSRYALNCIDVSCETLFSNKDVIIYKKMPSMACRAIYKRDLIINNHLWFHEGVLFEDLEWVPQMLYNSTAILYVPIAFYYYRQSQNSITRSNFSCRQINDVLTIGNILAQFVQSIPHPQIQSQIRYNVFYWLFMCHIRCKQKLTSETKERVHSLLGQLKPISKHKTIRLIYYIFPNITICISRQTLKLKWAVVNKISNIKI